LPAADGHGRVAEGNLQVGVAGSAVVQGGAADGQAAELGEGGQGGVPADPVEGAGLSGFNRPVGRGSR
jgi:hypothetical protein